MDWANFRRDRSLFIRDLPLTLDEEALRTSFSTFGALDVFLLRKKSAGRKSRGR